LVYLTYLGGSSPDLARAIAVDSAGNAYVTGFTRSTNSPTANALQATLNGFQDAFVTKLNAAGTAFVYSTYLGGGGSDDGQGIALDPANNAYITGSTTSMDNLNGAG
jgi:Beta-propeller repeat